jgi:hypothetical protein
MGSPEALATPITFDVELDGKVDRAYKERAESRAPGLVPAMQIRPRPSGS